MWNLWLIENAVDHSDTVLSQIQQYIQFQDQNGWLLAVFIIASLPIAIDTDMRVLHYQLQVVGLECWHIVVSCNSNAANTA